MDFIQMMASCDFVGETRQLAKEIETEEEDGLVCNQGRSKGNHLKPVFVLGLFAVTCAVALM